jgi:hypothetical protein
VDTDEVVGIVEVGVTIEVERLIERGCCIIVFCDRNKNSKPTLHYSNSETCCRSSSAMNVYVNAVPTSHIFRDLQSCEMLRSVCFQLVNNVEANKLFPSSRVKQSEMGPIFCTETSVARSGTLQKGEDHNYAATEV